MNYSLYIHIPFCAHRCHYCDFNTYVGKDALVAPYFDALIKELRIVNNQDSKINIHSIYFGGGTPSLIPLELYRNLLSTIFDQFNITRECEISIEANPSTLSQEYLVGLKALSFNRISLGVQSTNNFDLKRLDRSHNIWDVLNSVEKIRKSGFKNLNLDLIFGLPWQDLHSWKNCLSRAIKLEPEHFSIYSLIVEPGTPLFSWYQRGLIAQQDQDLEGDMYKATMDILSDSGYEQYEISNWSKSGTEKDYRCQHNLQYWLGYPYLGIGAGAHGFAAGYRTVNIPTIKGYIQKINETANINKPFPGTSSQISMNKIALETQMMDFMMVGLRLTKEGVSENRFFQLFGKSMKNVFEREINTLICQDLITWADDAKSRLILTKRGIMVANQVFMAFV